jgi:hypothetical protein
MTHLKKFASLMAKADHFSLIVDHGAFSQDLAIFTI